MNADTAIRKILDAATSGKKQDAIDALDEYAATNTIEKPQPVICSYDPELLDNTVILSPKKEVPMKENA